MQCSDTVRSYIIHKVLHNKGGAWHLRVAYQIAAERPVRRVTACHTTKQLSEQC